MSEKSIVEVKVPFPIQLYEEVFLTCRENELDMDEFFLDSVREGLERVRAEREKERKDGGTYDFDVIFRRAEKCKCGGNPQYFVNFYDGNVRVNCSKCDRKVHETGIDAGALSKAVKKWNES